MELDKYYDYAERKPLSDKSKCDYDFWLKHGFQDNTYCYTIHPKGYLIFIDGGTNDEYEEDDPYSFDYNSIFHKARINSTMSLINSVFDVDGSFTLLDIGCGKGFITNEICREFHNAEISGLDYSISAINQATNRFPDIEFIAGDAYNLPYKEEYFDIVLMNNIWEHVPDPLHLLRQVKKVLKPKGHIIISTPSRYRSGNIIRKITGRPVGFMSNLHVTEYSVGQVVEQLRYGGFAVKKIHSSRDYEVKTVKQVIVQLIFKPIISLALKYTTPYHCLNSTCYYLARKELA